MKTLYFDCFSGISGDMAVGALLDAGADEKVLLEGLSQLKADGYRIKIEKKLKNGISGTDFSVLLDEQNDNGHVHRNIGDIERIINDSGLNERVRKLSTHMFKLVAEAEGKIHRMPAEEVHFHEVGAIDSIVDIIGTAICIDDLDADRIVFSSLPLSKGFVKCQHGVIPLPAPAALEILKNVPVYFTNVNFELVTPTGAAIAKGLADEFGIAGEFEVERIGYGLGKRTYEIPNVLRVVIFNSFRKD